MKIRIDEIKVKNRIRKNIGELRGLRESISKFGLLQPIIVDTNNNLIAGMRRLTVARELGWEEIEANVVSLSGKENYIQIEAEENTTRIDFTWQEKERIKRLLQRYNRKSLWGRFLSFLLDLWEKITKKEL